MRLVELIEHRAHDVDIASFVPGSDVVDRARSPILQCQQNRSAMVLHIDPVADITAIAIDWNALVLERIGQHQGQEFLRELAWPIVIATSGNHRIETKSLMSSAHQMFRGGL